MPGSPQRDGLSYFDLARRKERSSDSSSLVSPNANPDQSSTPASPYTRRPVYPVRPHSDHSSARSRVKVHTIEAGIIAGKSCAAPPPVTGTHLRSVSDDNRPITEDTADSGKPGIHTSQDGRRTAAPEDGRLIPARLPSTGSVEPPTRPRPGHKWSRSKSGSIWYEKLRQSPSQSPNASHRDSDKTDDVPNVERRLLTPLRPPLSPISAPTYHHAVRVETSFTELQPSSQQLTTNLGHTDSTSTSNCPSRRNSVDPKKLLPNPVLRLIRRLSKPESKKMTKTDNAITTNPTTAIKPQLPDHKSLLRRHQTADGLKEVTARLERWAPPSILSPLSVRTFSDRSGSDSQDSKPHKHQHKHQKKMVKGLVVDNDVLGHRSLSNLARYDSQTSSQLDLLQGAAPHNTPDERATYKIKRSPSAGTEEFLKVDINIRGGTSYLPSEARRIHTPPLPQDGLDGKKRGFFFDYNAPRVRDSRTASLSSPLSEPNLAGKIGPSVPRRATSKLTIASRRNISSPKVVTRVKAGDWYDAKLAELETDDDEETLQGTPTGLRGRSATTSTSILALARKKTEDEQMDYNIPEHLPSSPLCPRNKKYWRVVKGRGSQYRGCWMHGVGEYE